MNIVHKLCFGAKGNLFPKCQDSAPLFPRHYQVSTGTRNTRAPLHKQISKFALENCVYSCQNEL